MKRDSIANTFVVAGGLCIVCSLVVSGTAVLLSSLQERNAELDRKRNILQAAGLIEGKVSGEQVEAIFAERIKDTIVNLETGEDVTDQYDDPVAFDQSKAAKSADLGVTLSGTEDIASIKRRSKHSHVYQVLPEGGSGGPTGYVFPVRGYGLWSTLYGFLAVEADMQTVSGLTFYQHAETPGLGGEVDNPKWKAQWVGKKIYGSGEAEEDAVAPVELEVVKGVATAPNLEHKIDGLSGATITSKGVSNLVKYWMGPNGFGTYVEKLRQQTSAGQAKASAREELTHG